MRFRPEQMLDSSAPEPKRRAVLNKLISIGVGLAKPAETHEIQEPQPTEPSGSDSPGETPRQGPGGFFGPAFEALFGPTSHDAGVDDSPHSQSEEDEADITLPIVRPADYFLASHDHDHDDSMVYLPLTDFVGVGLADDTPDTIEPLYYSDIEEQGLSSDVGPFFGEAVQSLRRLNLRDGKPGLELGVAKVARAEVFLFTGPANYQSSWFADLDMTQTVAESLTTEYGDVLPLFVPASRTSFFVVMADDPHLADLFRTMAGSEKNKDAIYPLPHTVASDGWQEWIPLPDHPAAKPLSALRVRHRARIYAAQAKSLRTWAQNMGEPKEYEAHSLRSGDTVSTVRWTNTDGFGSIPRTDFISFVRKPSDLPWDEDKGDVITVRSDVARDVWADGITQIHDVWPPRWAVRGFPDPEHINALREAAHREV